VHDAQPPKNGGIPHSYRLALAWRWIPGMPRQLRRRKGFLTALHTLSTMADARGRTRFADTGQPIRLRQLADAMGSDEKEARRYLSAAIAAGVLGTESDPRRGRTTVYILILAPSPRWAAAAAVLDVGGREHAPDTTLPASAEAEHARADEPSQDSEFGGRVPELAPAPAAVSSGDGSPFSPEQVRGTGPRCSSGDGSPLSSGDGSPNNPGVPKNYPQEMVAVGPQPDGARGRGPHAPHPDVDDHRPPPAARPPLRSVPSPLPGTRAPRRAIPDGQTPLVMAVPGPRRPADGLPAPGPGITASDIKRDGWRATFADLHHAMYHDPTGT
jgi:hypothetical protein